MRVDKAFQHKRSVLCPSLLSRAVIKHSSQKKCGERRVCFSLYFHTRVHHCRKSESLGLKVGTKAEAVEEEHCLLTWLMICLACFLMQPRTPLHHPVPSLTTWHGTTYSGLGLPSSILTKENAPKALPRGQSNQDYASIKDPPEQKILIYSKLTKTKKSKP